MTNMSEHSPIRPRKTMDRRAIGRVTSDWNERYPVTPLRIDAVTRETETVYSAQLGFPDGSDAEFDVSEDVLRAPGRFPKLLTRCGRIRYSQGQWMLFDELSDGAFKLVTERMGGAWATDSPTQQEMAVLPSHLPRL